MRYVTWAKQIPKFIYGFKKLASNEFQRLPQKLTTRHFLSTVFIQQKLIKILKLNFISDFSGFVLRKRLE
jgi:hypothetical protein